MKKRILLLLVFLFLVNTAIPVFAEGDGNMDGGGSGDWGTGTTSSKWSPGNDGVRVSVVDAGGNTVGGPVDFSNRAQTNVVHFGRVNKIQYRNGASLSPSSSTYISYQPARPLPTIISTSGVANIPAIRAYWCSEYAAQLVADKTGIPLDSLISGQYKLLVEPLSYFHFNSVFYCMTATEVGYYDNLASGKVRYALRTMSHTNLPLAIFLERSDLGFDAWTGSRTAAASNGDIIRCLGVGIVSYSDEDPWGDMNAPDYTYRVDTDVITSVELYAGARITPEQPASVTFHILGAAYTVSNVVIPEGESQLVWVKWHTPSTPQTVNISVSATGGTVGKANITASVIDLDDRVPPDPTANDSSPGFSPPGLPASNQRTNATWGVWNCHWEPLWEWEQDMRWHTDPCDAGCPRDCDQTHGHWEDHGKWVDNGDWEYTWTGYSASLSASMSLRPDDIVPTSGGTMKSGYGVQMQVTTNLSTSAPDGHYTYAQTCITFFPEFQYSFYSRLLQRATGGRNAQFLFKPNPHSTYNRNVHFTPVWYPDTQYTVYGEVWDVWTPAGMLSVSVSDSVIISGSLFDDWYTNRE